MDERRVHPRFPLLVPITISTPFGEATGMTGNISAGGLSLTIPFELPKETLLSIEITFPETLTTLTGQVVLQIERGLEQFMTGISFFEVPLRLRSHWLKSARQFSACWLNHFESLFEKYV